MTDVKRLLDEATPLPWQVYETPGDPISGDWFITKQDDAAFIHKMEDYDSKEVATGWTSPLTNALLIVYAVNRLPDYEAAVDAMEQLVALTDGWDEAIGGSEWLERIEVARAALARLRESVLA